MSPSLVAGPGCRRRSRRRADPDQTRSASAEQGEGDAAGNVGGGGVPKAAADRGGQARRRGRAPGRSSPSPALTRRPRPECGSAATTAAILGAAPGAGADARRRRRRRGLDVVGQRGRSGRGPPRRASEEAGPRTGPQLDPLVGTSHLAEHGGGGAPSTSLPWIAPGSGLRGEDEGPMRSPLTPSAPGRSGAARRHRRLARDVQPDHEAVELGLGQRVGALVGESGTGGDHQEGRPACCRRR